MGGDEHTVRVGRIEIHLLAAQGNLIDMMIRGATLSSLTHYNARQATNKLAHDHRVSWDIVNNIFKVCPCGPGADT